MYTNAILGRSTVCDRWRERWRESMLHDYVHCRSPIACQSVASCARHVMSRKKAAAIVLLLSTYKFENEKRRRLWVRPWIARRHKLGAFHDLLGELRIEDAEQYRNFVRMTKSDVEELLSLIGPTISKMDTKLRDAISPAEKLIVTLRFLASGDSYGSLQYLFRIPPTTMAFEVCEAIYEALKASFLKMPTTPEEWMAIVNKFAKKCNFPQCIGALDGKHVVMQAPQNSGSYYYNYKGTHSIVLMALVDSNCRIIYMDIGCNGRISDGGVFGNCSLSTALEDNTVQMPPPSQLPGRRTAVPYVLVADDAFPMKNYLMKPYPFRNQPAPNRVFNYRVSRARRTVENCFGLMANKYRVLRKPILLGPERTVSVIKAICSLHNFLLDRKESASYYLPPGEVDTEDPVTGEVQPGAWRNEGFPTTNLISLQQGANRNYPLSAKSVRNEYRDYFVSPQGEVPWQYRFI